jgi:hypothetical protein
MMIVNPILDVNNYQKLSFLPAHKFSKAFKAS